MRKVMFLILLIMGNSIFVSCGPGQLLGPRFTETPIATPTSTLTLTPSPTPTKTNTPTPTSTSTSTPSPTPIAGIEEPIEVSGTEFLIKSAIVKDQFPSLSGPKLPKLGYQYIAITVTLKIDEISCDGKEYNPEDLYLMIFSEGLFSGLEFFFEIPEDVDPIICEVRIENHSITLAPFFQQDP